MATTKRPSARESIEECQRLHHLMREAEREIYELRRRIDSWNILNHGTLVNIGAPIRDQEMVESCHCSVCSPTVALQLLILWSRIFSCKPMDVQTDPKFLGVLLSDPPGIGKTLSDFMREVVKDIATKSMEGATQVLIELRKKLNSSDDSISAEILGRIMKVQGSFMSVEFAELAMEILSKQQGL